MKTTSLGLKAVLACSIAGAVAAEEQFIEIPAQPLTSAIRSLGEQTGIQVGASADMLKDEQSTAISGTMSPQDALLALLGDSSLQIRKADTNSFIVSRNNFVAQNATEDDFIELDPIIVRGELQERDLFSSPTSVAVESGADLELRGERSVLGVVERTPNVSGTAGRQGFSIRGIDQRGVGGGGSGLVVSTQVDGVALPSNQSTFFGPYSTWDLEQVEVLRGPQSTQQGRNALAGAIVLRSRDPEFTPEYKLRGEYGSRNSYRAALVANVPVIEDRLAFRFSAEKLADDGWVDNPILDTDYDAADAETYRFKLRWQATEAVDLIFGYTYATSEAGEDLVRAETFPDDRFNLSNIPAEEGSRHNIYDLRVGWDINTTLRLESETNYYTQDYRRREDRDGTPANLAVLDTTGDDEVFEQDFRLRFDRPGIQGVVGVFYTEIRSGIDSGLRLDLSTFDPQIPPGIVVDRSIDLSDKTKNFAIFGEADIDASAWLSGLSFTAGIRYDWEKQDFSNETRYSIPLPPPFVDSSDAGDTTFSAFLPKFGINYDINATQRISLTYQRGYRAGGSEADLSGQVNEFDPEFTDNYELAYRAEFLDNRLFVRANVFYADWKDQQVRVQTGFVPNVGAITQTFNAGRSRVWGGELSADAQVTSNLSLFGGIGYANTRFTEFVSGGRDFAGNQFPNAPEWTGSIGGRYTWDNGVSWGVDMSYTDGSFSNAANTPATRSDSRFLVNTDVTYEFGDQWIAGLFVRNLFDRDYITFVSTENAFDAIRTGEPRTIGAYLNKTF